MNQNADRLIIKAAPTKEFFINMLVKDIRLVRSIIDLVDNSLDGARRLRSNGNYSDLEVRIEAESDHFRISDNCGGIPVSIARDYAFRFGRPEGMPMTPHSTGRFGVGMKRSIFKLGINFKITSTTEESRFVVEEDVEDWKRRPDDWRFRFKELNENGVSYRSDLCGTTIEVTSLHDSVSREFEQENFQTQLRIELEEAHRQSMEQGLAIALNSIPLEIRLLDLLQSDQITPISRDLLLENGNVTVKLIAGMSNSNPSEAGWYIFCNGRLLIGMDQTIITGWGDSSEKVIPKYHNQFARFRGYTFFDSDDPTLLPWNTTKTGVDSDSAIFKAVRLEMIRLMRPVIDFLNELDREKDHKDETGDAPLEDAVAAAGSHRLSEIKPSDQFVAPKSPTIVRLPRTGRIQYNKPVEHIKIVKKVLGVSTYKEVGEKTFEYFYDRECNEQ